MVSKRPKPGDRICSRDGCANTAKPGRWYCPEHIRESDRRTGKKRRQELKLLRRLLKQGKLEVRSNALVQH
jgi:hypothetical protein